MAAEVETMFSVRERPWHGLGTIVEEAPDSETALKLAGLDFSASFLRISIMSESRVILILFFKGFIKNPPGICMM